MPMPERDCQTAKGSFGTHLWFWDVGDFILHTLGETYQELLPCFWLLLVSILCAQNYYEKHKKTERLQKKEHAQWASIVIISIALFTYSASINAFQLIFGIFLSTSGADQCVLDVCNHMGLSVSHKTVGRALGTMTKSAIKLAQAFVVSPLRLWYLVYDNINFTRRKKSERLDSKTEQLNATTSAVCSFPKRYTREKYANALKQSSHHRDRRNNLVYSEIEITPAKQVAMREALKHGIRTILLKYAPGLRRRSRNRQQLRKEAKQKKPRIRTLDHEKTEFFPLPAVDEEEASVRGTLWFIYHIFLSVLWLPQVYIRSLMFWVVGDWLTIRNLRLMRAERVDSFKEFDLMRWIKEVSMPFHFQLNAMYAIYRTHIGHDKDNGDAASLDHHRKLLQRSKLDTSKPEYNKARELVRHSLIARILDCARIICEKNGVAKFDTKDWRPSPTAFEDLVEEIISTYVDTSAADSALRRGDEVLAHSILFIRDALMFEEFAEAVRDADVGRMWLVYDFWLFMFRGAGCHNYGNEIKEMKADHIHVLEAEASELTERSWLVNRWGKKGRSIPTDLYLEHNNGFIKKVVDAAGGGVTIKYICEKVSATVEVVRTIRDGVMSVFGVKKYHRRHAEVATDGDVRAIRLDLEKLGVHTFKPGRKVPPPKSKGKKRKTGVRDMLLEGIIAVREGGLFEKWKQRGNAEDGSDEEGSVDGDDNSDGEDGYGRGTAFERGRGHLEVDLELDREFYNGFVGGQDMNE